MTNLFDLTGKVAVVTGGNSGIGLGMAHALAKAGAHVALWSRNEERNAEAAKEVRAHGTDVIHLPCDVANEDDVIAAMKSTLDHFGRVDASFANAGFGRPRPFTETTLKDWNVVVNVNLTGTFLTFRETLKHMVERGGGGKLIATSSIGNFCGMPRQGAYAATKSAVCALVRSLAVEFGRNDVQVNAILPGWIDTPALSPIFEMKKLHDTVVHRTPANRIGKPEDLDGIAVYLASDASRFTTGQILTVDGGYSIF